MYNILYINVYCRNEIVKFTIYDLIITISSTSDLNFQKCKEAGLFNSILNEIESKDILVKLNTIELFIKVYYYFILFFIYFIFVIISFYYIVHDIMYYNSYLFIYFLFIYLFIILF